GVSGSRGARDDQAVSQTELGPLGEMAVSPLPRAILESAAQPREPCLHGTDLGKRGDGAADAGIEVRVGPPPVRAEKPVGAIVRHRKNMGLDQPEGAPHLVEGWEEGPVDLPDGGEVVIHEPEARARWV